MLSLITSAIISIVILIRSSQVFVGQSITLAKKRGVSDFFVGFTIVALGTSLPELVSNIFSSLSDHPKLAISNVIGGNIFNICLILGIISIFKAYQIKKRDVNVNIPINIAALGIFWALLLWFGFSFNWAAGASLILFFLAFMILSKEHNRANIDSDDLKEFNIIYLLLSLVLLIGSGKVVIDSIINLVTQLNIPETVFGYFVLPLATSSPELITTLVAIKKGHKELGIGNLLGSNLFNLTFILGISSIITKLDFTDLKMELVFLTIITVASYIFAVMGKKYYFSKREGWGLVILYGLFILGQIAKRIM